MSRKRKNPISNVVQTRGYLINPHAGEDEEFEWYHVSKDEDLMFLPMDEAPTEFPAFYLSSTVSGILDLEGVNYNDYIYILNVKEGKYFDAQNIDEKDFNELYECLKMSVASRGIPKEDADFLAEYQLQKFTEGEMWYWMESVPAPAKEVELNPDYALTTSRIIKGTKVKCPHSGNAYIFYRGYPDWKYPAIFIDCLRSLGYDGWFETQNLDHASSLYSSPALPQITIALLDPEKKAERNGEPFTVYMAEHFLARGELP